MAKYTVEFSCGHIDTIDLVGPYEERYKKIDFLEREGLCPDCYKGKIKKNQEKTIAAYKEKYNLCNMEGTEKQIAWAENIRKEFFTHFDDIDLEKIKNENKALTKATIAYFANITSSKFWIDNRDDSLFLSSMINKNREAILASLNT